MNKFYHSLYGRLGVALLLLIIAFIIHSCKKELKDDTADLSSAVLEAKAWYELNFPQNTPASLTVQNNGSGQHKADFSQLIKPDWQHNASYTRFNKDVIEIPVDSATQVKFQLNVSSKLSNKNYTRGYYLLLKNATGYDAYVMMVVADSDYVKGDVAKLAHNTYRKHDADFNGMVLYFTPKGDFLQSYLYKNGKLVIKPAVTATHQTNASKNNTIDHETVNCVYYYWIITYYDGRPQSWTYLYTICEGGSGGGSGGGGGGSGQGAPCTPGTHSVNGGIQVNSIDDDANNDGSGDGGFPPPPPPTSTGAVTGCSVPAIPVDTTKKKDPCAEKTKINAAQANGKINKQDSTIKTKLTSDPTNEWGVEHRMSAISGGDFLPLVPSQGSGAFWNISNFYWASTNGYTVGFSHDHLNSGPDVDDIALGLQFFNQHLYGSPAADQAFFQSNYSITSITQFGTYISTVSDWAAYTNIISVQYGQNISNMDTQWQTFATEYLNNNYSGNNGDAAAYALMKIFNNSVNVYFKASNQTNYVPITTNSNHGISTVTCP